MNLPETVKQDILDLAKKHCLSKVILFGSRARGDNKERSDIDLAVSGGDVISFSLDADEDLPTLLMFDIVNLDGSVQEELLESIQKEGILLYEKS